MSRSLRSERWCVYGVMHLPRAASASPHTTLLLSETANEERSLQDLSEEERRSFSIHALGVSGKPRQNKEKTRAVAMLESSAQLAEALEGPKLLVAK